MVEVFITNVENTSQGEQIKKDLLMKYPKLKIAFDLEDIDKVLRIEGCFDSNEIMRILVSKKYKCEIME